MPGTTAAGEAVGVTDKSPRAPLGLGDAADVCDDGADDGGDAVCDEEQAAIRNTAEKPMDAFNAALLAAVTIRELNTRLVKTKSLGRASLVGNEFCERW
jgi:hypothetical protein